MYELVHVGLCFFMSVDMTKKFLGLISQSDLSANRKKLADVTEKAALVKLICQK